MDKLLEKLEKKTSILKEQFLKTEEKKTILSEMKRIGIEKLPYSYSALNKFIDSETMNFHYNKHYKGYVKKLNKALSEKDYGDVELEEIVKSISRYNKTIRNNAGGAFNHALFWKMLSPKKQELKGELLTKINKEFGSLTKFKKEFEEKAKKSFGSGWVWLTVSNNNRLKIVTTPNQDNPLMNIISDGGFPILGLDLWEHAYYLKYRNERDEYISNFWDCVNWEFVTSLYMSKQKKKTINEGLEMKEEQPVHLECTPKKENEFKFVFNTNTQLKTNFRIKINEIFKSLFPENWRDWGQVPKGDLPGLYDIWGVQGRHKINYLTSHYTSYCVLLADTNKVLLHMNEKPIQILGLTPEEQLKENERFLEFVDRFKERIFNPNSRTLKTILSKIKGTNIYGEKREDFVVQKLKLKYGEENVKKVGSFGKASDALMGEDITIKIDGSWKTGQVKPYESYKIENDIFHFFGVSNVEEHGTNFMVFHNFKDNKILMFATKNAYVKDGVYIVPKQNLVYLYQ